MSGSRTGSGRCWIRRSARLASRAEVLGDGMTVEVDPETDYEPDRPCELRPATFA